MSDDAADAIAVIDGNRARDAAIIHDASTVERMTKALWEFMNSKKFKDAAAARLTTAHSDYAMYTGSPIETADLAAKLCDVARAAEKLIHPDKKGRPDVQNEALNALLQVPALYTPANIANRSFDPNGHTFVTEILAKILTYTKTHYEDAYRAAYNSSTGSNTLTAEARKTALLQVASIFDLGPKSAEFRIELIRGLVGTTNPTLTAEGTALVESLAKSEKKS